MRTVDNILLIVLGQVNGNLHASKEMRLLWMGIVLGTNPEREAIKSKTFLT